MSKYYAVSEESDVVHASGSCSHLSNAAETVAYFGVPEGKRVCYRCDPNVERIHE